MRRTEKGRRHEEPAIEQCHGNQIAIFLSRRLSRLHRHGSLCHLSRQPVHLSAVIIASGLNIHFLSLVRLLLPLLVVARYASNSSGHRTEVGSVQLRWRLAGKQSFGSLTL